MTKVLDKLSAPELETLSRAPLLVCILIAGADNEIDNKEIRSAIKMANGGSGKSKSGDGLSQFLKVVTEDIEDKLKIIISTFPQDSAERNPILLDELKRLNKILPKIDKSFASGYYRCLLQIARKVAESSGGLLGIQAIGDEEEQFIGLPMIKNPAAA
jgi:hypothetical protein